jgi:hypothetical protein
MKPKQVVLFLQKKNQKDFFTLGHGRDGLRCHRTPYIVMAGLDPAGPPPAIHALTDQGVAVPSRPVSRRVGFNPPKAPAAFTTTAAA